MKYFSTIFFSAYFLCIYTGALTAQTGKTVLDYYLEIPEGHYMCDMTGITKDSKDYRVSKIVRMDTRSGYLLALNDYLWIQVAQFTYGKKNIIGVVVICGMGCMCNIENFYEIQANGDFKDVTYDILPKECLDDGWIILPEVGTTIKVYDTEKLEQYNGVPITEFTPKAEMAKKALKYELMWEKGVFKQKKS